MSETQQLSQFFHYENIFKSFFKKVLLVTLT